MTESMHTDPDLARGIWAGDKAKVEDARAKFLANPKGQMSAWISTLYSFRRYKECADKLVGMFPVVLDHTERLDRILSSPIVNQKAADRANVAASVLLWLSRQDMPLQPTQRAWLWADKIATTGLRVADYTPGEHTPALLALNKADSLASFEPVKPGSRRLSRAYLRLAWALAPFVKDQNQCVRVWKGLGWAYLSRWNPLGLWFLLRAVGAALEKGVPSDVLRKVFSLRG